MPIQQREDIRDELEADIYGTEAADVSTPKYRMPSTGCDPTSPTRW